MGRERAEAARSRASQSQRPARARKRRFDSQSDDRVHPGGLTFEGLPAPWSPIGKGPRRWRALEVQQGLNLLGDGLAGVVVALLLGLSWLPAIGLVAGAVVALGVRGTRRPELSGSAGPSLGDLVGSVSVVTVAVALFIAGRERAAVLEAGMVLASAVIGVRVLSRRLRAVLVAHQVVSAEPILIVGAGQVGEQLALGMLDHPDSGLLPLGFVDSVNDADLVLPVLASPARLESCAARLGVRRIVVAFGRASELDVLPKLRVQRTRALEVYVVPRLFDLGLASAGHRADWVWGMPLVPLRRSPLSSPAWRAKRAIDVVGAAGLIVLLSPLLVVLSLAVRLSSPGPVFFRQRRVGQDGRVFEVLKFRSMLVNDEADTQWSVDQDARVTRVGRWLRRLSLDELPQLLNVIRGEMSLVGPRPERPFFVDRFRSEIPDYDFRHRVPSGLTGWAQVHGLRGNSSITDRVRFDNQYIESWSLSRDVAILLRTLGTIARDSLSCLRLGERLRRAFPKASLSSSE